VETLTRNASVREKVRYWRARGRKIALVPTAGTLHKGHLSLIAKAKQQSNHVIVCIFADPNGGNSGSLGPDRELLTKIGADVLFTPPLQEIYPAGYENAAVVNLPYFAEILEGAFRPGHLADVATILTKLFNIVKPHVAVFGERDYQQLVIVRRMIDDLFIPVDIVACATSRDGDGLAFATVNRLLSPEERVVAPRLYATLGAFGRRIEAGERDFEALMRQGREALVAEGFKPEYFAIRQALDLAPVRAGTRELVILAAAHLGTVRLIDNLRVALADRP
jgi:pantoate--beta-alanine ligase